MRTTFPISGFDPPIELGWVRGGDHDLTLKWYQSHGLGGSANDFLKWFKIIDFEIVCKGF